MNSEVNVAIIILNWRNWPDTIECLESVRQTEGVNYKIIVCDNDSRDGSVAKIASWAAGEVSAKRDGAPWQLMDRGEQAARQSLRTEILCASQLGHYVNERDLTIIANSRNLGFAGGNNVSLAYALANVSFTHFFVLNNDTVVRPDTVEKLVKRMGDDPRIGICGAKIMDYYEPAKLQAAGGAIYSRKQGTSTYITEPHISRADAERKMDYVCGASMMVTRRFVEEVGLMSEDYFLYFEELDWVLRGTKRFTLGYADDSILYHKEGGTIGSKSEKRASNLSLFYLTRNRLLFTRKFFPDSTVPVVFRLFFECAVYAKRRDFSALSIVAKCLIFDLLYRPQRTMGFGELEIARFLRPHF